MKKTKKLFFKIFATVLILPAVCLCAIGCNKTGGKYDIVRAEYYIQKVNEFKQENAVLNGGVDCIFIGDSWTDGYRPLQEYYPEMSVLNRGIGGDNSWGLLQRLDESVFAVNPKIVVMLIGGNNMLTCKADIKTIVLKIKAKLPSTKIVMQSMYGTCEEFYKSNNKKMVDLNEYFKKLSQKYNLTYVDLYSHLVDENGKGIEEYHVADGVHISELGYEKITSVLKPVLLKLL